MILIEIIVYLVLFGFSIGFLNEIRNANKVLQIQTKKFNADFIKADIVIFIVSRLEELGYNVSIPISNAEKLGHSMGMAVANSGLSNKEKFVKEGRLLDELKELSKDKELIVISSILYLIKHLDIELSLRASFPIPTNDVIEYVIANKDLEIKDLIFEDLRLQTMLPVIDSMYNHLIMLEEYYSISKQRYSFPRILFDPLKMDKRGKELRIKIDESKKELAALRE